MNARIVRATPDDVPWVMRLAGACIDDMRRRGIDQWDDIYPSARRFTADATAGTLFVAQTDSERVIGAVVIDDFQDPEYADVRWAIGDAPIGVVHRLMVHPCHQGCGVARALMRFAEDHARQRGYRTLRLDAFTRNPNALRLYPALGYRDAGSILLRKGQFRCFEKTLGVTIRPERPEDAGAIRDVTRRAFADVPYGGGNEHDIIDALRNKGALTVSLVAEDAERVIAHAAFSPAVAPDRSPGWFTLGPVAVTPDRQRQGIGRSLIDRGLTSLRTLGASGCIVVGDVTYYAFFGFVPAPASAPAGTPADHFMVLRFGAKLPAGAFDFDGSFYQP